MNGPHDRLFKAAFGRTELAAEFLERYLAATAVQALDWTTLQAASSDRLTGDELRLAVTKTISLKDPAWRLPS